MSDVSALSDLSDLADPSGPRGGHTGRIGHAGREWQSQHALRQMTFLHGSSSFSVILEELTQQLVSEAKGVQHHLHVFRCLLVLRFKQRHTRRGKVLLKGEQLIAQTIQGLHSLLDEGVSWQRSAMARTAATAAAGWFDAKDLDKASVSA